MMKTKFFIPLILFLSITLRLFATTDKFELKTGSAQLLIDQKNNLKISYNNGAIRMNTLLNKLWRITIKNQDSGKEYLLGADTKIIMTQSGDTIHINVIGGSTIPLKGAFTISVKEGAFCFGGSLHIEEGWIISEVVYPVFEKIQFKTGKAGIYWPAGLGQYYQNPDDFESKNSRYPSGGSMTMPWFSLNRENTGLYIGCHDSLQETKVFNLEYNKSTGAFNTYISAEVFNNEYSIPDIIINPYSGKWHVASKFYRNWYDKHFEIRTPPEWVKDNSGWLLAIMKQQNMEVMWTYKEIDKLCDIAEQFNLHTIGLFGWGFGGHDHLYPFYTPDNSMGGRPALEAAIKRAQRRGVKIIIYANGKIMDTSTDFYAYYGQETMVIQKNLQPQIQYYIKQRLSTPVIFAQACDGSDVWRRTMYDLGVQAASLGADGILYDQLGALGAYLCYSAHHDHRQGLTDSKNRLDMANQSRTEARKINPEFIVMTESTHDQIIQGIDFHHGWGVAYQPSSVNDFPALFRYTFPELITTQRNPNPMITRTDANFAVIYGLRHEIESRYPGDVDYLLNGTLPTKESYSNEVSPPNIQKMNIEPAAKARQYVHSLIAFEMENSDFFRRGNFIDGEGIEVTGENILAKGFTNGNRLGVIVWNQHLTETRNFSLLTPGYELKGAKEPGNKNVEALSQLQPNSIRLIIYEKKQIK